MKTIQNILLEIHKAIHENVSPPQVRLGIIELRIPQKNLKKKCIKWPEEDNSTIGAHAKINLLLIIIQRNINA